MHRYSHEHVIPLASNVSQSIDATVPIQWRD